MVETLTTDLCELNIAVSYSRRGMGEPATFSLGVLARQARRILDDTGLPNVRIVVSGGLDEHAIAELVASGAQIDAYGVGTKTGVSVDAPCPDTADKVVPYGDRPVALTAGLTEALRDIAEMVWSRLRRPVGAAMSSAWRLG